MILMSNDQKGEKSLILSGILDAASNISTWAATFSYLSETQSSSISPRSRETKSFCRWLWKETEARMRMWDGAEQSKPGQVRGEGQEKHHTRG